MRFPFLPLLILIFFACDQEEEALLYQGEAEFHRSHAALIAEESREVFLDVSLVSEVPWKVVRKPDWLTVTPESGTITAERTTLTLTAQNDNPDREAGFYTGGLGIQIADNREVNIVIGFNHLVQPQLDLYPPEPFEVPRSWNQFGLVNLGDADSKMDFEILEAPEWLNIEENVNQRGFFWGDSGAGYNVTIAPIIPVGRTEGILKVYNFGQPGEIPVVVIRN